MDVTIGTCALAIEVDPFRWTVSRDGQTILAIHPKPEPVSVRNAGSALMLDLPGGRTLAAILTGNRLDIRGDGDSLVLAFDMIGEWFGHGELIHQRLPLNRIMLQSAPLLSFDNSPTGLSGIPTPLWFSSHGLAIVAHSPVAVGINQPPDRYPRHAWSLSQAAPFDQRPFADLNGEGDGKITLQGNDLHVTLFFTEDAVSAYREFVRFAGHPTEMPPADLFTLPTWTTWARYKTAIDQAVVLNFAEEIVRHGYPHGVMEIDDRWQVHYGDLSFDPARFPDPKGMIDRLHAQGFKVTAWVIPFLDAESEAFAAGRAHSFLVRERSGDPYLVPWWQGRGGLLDVTNPAALEWFHQRLEKLRGETGLDGFKFDAGEANFLPADAVTHVPIERNEYTRRYVDFVAARYRLCEVRSGWMNQRAPIFFRQWDKTTAWGMDNGLHSVLTGMLALGLTGYPFILPDMIGGNAYNEQATAELMIRWTQLNALLPAMQLSLAPWDYGEECTRLCKQYVDLHVHFAPKILEIAAESTRTGEPIIRPIWWNAPTDTVALTCDDEFLLGDDLLAAPVIHPGARSRDIYLPPGAWRDYRTGTMVEGGRILKAHPAPLEILPLFERQ